MGFLLLDGNSHQSCILVLSFYGFLYHLCCCLFLLWNLSVFYETGRFQGNHLPLEPWNTLILMAMLFPTNETANLPVICRQQVGVDWLKWPIRWLSSYSSWWIVLRLIVIVKVDLCFKNGSFQVLSFSSPSRYRSMIGTFWSSLQFLLSVIGLLGLLAGWKEGW